MSKYVFGKQCHNNPQHILDVIRDIINSDAPLAEPLRHHLAASGIYPNTEPCVDLKLLTREPGRIAVGHYKRGMLTRDSEDHFIFIENESKTVKFQRGTRIYSGECINLNIASDGMLRVTFNRPSITSRLLMRRFLLKAAEEMRRVASQIAQLA